MTLVARLRALTGRRFARELLWVGASRLTTALVRLAGIRILTELIEPAVFGVVGLTIGMSLLATNILCFPILEATFRFYTDAAREGRIAEHRTLLAGLLRTRARLALGCLLVGGLGWSAWQGSEQVAWSFAAVTLLTALEMQRFFEFRLLNASRRQLQHAVWSLLDEVLRLACAAGAVWILGPEAVFVIAGYAVGVAGATAVFWRLRVRAEAGPPDLEWRSQRRAEVIRYAVPLSLLAVVGWLSTLSDRYILAALQGTEATGIYVAAYGLASQPFIVSSLILSLSFRPVYNDAIVRGDRRRERQVFLVWLFLLIFVLSAGVALMTFFAEPLTELLLAKDYGGAASLLPWIGAAYALQGCRQVFESLIFAQKRTSLLVVVELCTAIVSVSLYFALIPSLGTLGAAMGILGGMAVSLVGLTLLSGAIPRLRRIGR